MVFRFFFFVVVVLLAAFFFLNAKKKKTGDRSFKPPKFRDLRQEVNKGELKQDPLSGTWVAEGDAVKRTIKGTTYYFASEENADQWVRENC